MFVLIVLCGVGTLLTLLNSLTMRVVKPLNDARISSSVSVLIPMRNEESNVDGVVTSVQKSQGLSDWNFLALNDSSSDSTGALLEKHYIQKLDGTSLPEGWLGKNWACWQLAQASTGEYLVFLDADVRIDPTAIASSIQIMDELHWDFISPYPRQIAISFLERLFQPLLQWSWLASVPLRIAERFGVSSMTIANGQFMIIRRSAYFAIEGHSSIKGEVLDDLRLARTLIDAGFKGGVAEASSVAECRMYDSAPDLINGYTKSLWNAFGGIVGTIFTIALIALTQLVPIALGIAGYASGWIAYLLTALSHAIASARTKSSPANIFAHPLAALLLIVLIVESLRRKSVGGLVWRGRQLA